jgi:hypothetical protein
VNLAHSTSQTLPFENFNQVRMAAAAAAAAAAAQQLQQQQPIQTHPLQQSCGMSCSSQLHAKACKLLLQV